MVAAFTFFTCSEKARASSSKPKTTVATAKCSPVEEERHVLDSEPLVAKYAQPLKSSQDPTQRALTGGEWRSRGALKAQRKGQRSVYAFSDECRQVENSRLAREFLERRESRGLETMCSIDEASVLCTFPQHAHSACSTRTCVLASRYCAFSKTAKRDSV